MQRQCDWLYPGWRSLLMLCTGFVRSSLGQSIDVLADSRPVQRVNVALEAFEAFVFHSLSLLRFALLGWRLGHGKYP